MAGIQKRNRITNGKAAILIGITVILDLITIIPIGNWIAVALYFLTIPILFAAFGASYIKNPKRLFMLGGVSIVELIPALSILPAYTLGVVLNIINIRREDAKYYATVLPQIIAQQRAQEEEEQAEIERNYQMMFERRRREEYEQSQEA